MVTYAYNSDGVRVRQTASGQTTYFLIDPNNPTGYAKAVEERTDADSEACPRPRTMRPVQVVLIVVRRRPRVIGLR